MLRISLRLGKDFIPLEVELEHTISYLNIQKVRYEELLQYSITGDNSLLDMYVPKLIIQPIVENAIYHGIRGKKARGHIDINYRLENEFLIIDIIDDGIGFDVEKKDAKVFDEQRNISGGIGMNNVLSRIKILCGEKYGFEIDSKVGKGTKISLKLPLRES